MKNKKDIIYSDFLKFLEVIDGKDESELSEEELILEIKSIFFKGKSPNDKELNDLRVALETDVPNEVNDSTVSINGNPYEVNIDISKMTWGEFISAESDLLDEKPMDFLLGVLKRKYSWLDKVKQFVGIKQVELQETDISLSLAQEILAKYKANAKEEKKFYQWTFDPPPLPHKAKEETQGDIYRKEFSEHYGGYVELTYLVSNGDVLRWTEISNLPATEVLFKGEYLLRKNKVENIK